VTPKHGHREKRRWRRSSLNAPVRILTPTLVIDGFGIKVSEGGMYLFAAANLPIGETVGVEFRTPNSQNLVRSFGMIRSRAVYLYGLEFVPGGLSHHPGSPWPISWPSA
jgi:PilZ domain